MATTNSTSQTKIHQYQPLHPIIAKIDRLLDRMESRIDAADRRVDNLRRKQYRQNGHRPPPPHRMGSVRTRRPSCWDPPGNRPLPSFQPYDPPRSWQPSCREPPPHRASQGYSDYDQPPPCPPSCWDTPRRQTGHFRQQRSPRPGTQPWQPNRTVFDPPSHQRSAAPLPAAAPPPMPQRSPSNHLRSATKLVSCAEKQLGVEGDSDVLTQVDLRFIGTKLEDEEFCYETEWIPSSHYSSLDHDSDAHPKMKPNDSLNWRDSFLDVVDESKSSILDDTHDKAIYNDDEFTEMHLNLRG